jgi:glycosyltransferase involved in cell wall biosynthesis
LKILVVPTSDWLGHPYPSRHTHIFERIAQHDEVHVLRFRFYRDKKLETNIIVHEMDDFRTSKLALYYLINAGKHFRAVSKIAKENDIDMLVNANLLATYMAAKAIGNPSNIVFDLCDYYPTSAVGYYFDVQSFLGKIATFFLEKLLKKNLEHAGNIVASSHVLSDYAKKLGFRNVSLLPNGVDEFFFEKKYEGELIREKYGLDESLVIGYLGCVEFWIDMLPLLRAIQHLKRKYDVKLLLVGDRLRTKTPQRVQRQMRSMGIEENVVWLKNFVPYHDVPLWISAMDICTIPFNHHHPTAYYSAPIRLLEYLALEKPVLSTPVPEILTTAKDYVNVVLTEEDYEREIKSYIKDPTSYLEKAKQGKLVATQFTWTRIAQSYRRLLKEITEESRVKYLE